MADISKLPKWARDEIQTLRRQRDEVVSRLREFYEAQAPTAFFVEDLDVPGGKAVQVRRYIEGHTVCCEAHGVVVELTPDRHKGGVTVRFQADGRMGWALIRPEASNVITIVPERR